ncbi:hypothetical protein HY087_03055 [Candidatus Gottesmanbacteria bacterium]|nr:hypothetical protein [Candidatus Gottesmanbacteria bacterium]
MRRLFWAILVALLLFITQGASAAVSPFDKCKAGIEINTQIGCIDASGVGGFVGKLMRLSTDIAGGIAFLLILFSGFQILTSAGNPERLNEGKELLSSAIAGLLLIIFAVFLLKVIGVDILCIPGFGQC